jgi:isoleucyl-tRNA synthetase
LESGIATSTQSAGNQTSRAKRDEILALLNAEDTFRKSVDTRLGFWAFVFYEGPPSVKGIMYIVN